MRSSAAISSPVTIGSFVVLPADYRTWDSEKLRIVLAHERSHIRQGDFYLQALAGLYAAIVWFSPLGWWLKRQLSDLAEAISDRSGLEASGQPRLLRPDPPRIRGRAAPNPNRSCYGPFIESLATHRAPV